MRVNYGAIFKDIVDDQQESMMKTMHIGNMELLL